MYPNRAVLNNERHTTKTAMDVEINEQRLWNLVETFGEIGAVNDEAMMRVTGSEADRQARDEIVHRFEMAGLTVGVDSVGNIVGRREGSRDLSPVMAGSHVDTVPMGGRFDGTAGVLTALEAVMALDETGVETERPIALIVFTEEEGTRFGTGLLGSLVATEKLSVEEALALEDRDGVTLASALDEIGYRGDEELGLSDAAAFLELHVEQGPILYETDTPIGIVESVAGISHHRVTYTGEANHAGNTPMGHRHDAFAGAAEFAVKLETTAQEYAKRSATVGTVGSCLVEPNGTNVIPGRTELGVDIRDTNSETLEAIIDSAKDYATEVAKNRDLTVTWQTLLEVQPTEMSAVVRTELKAACRTKDVGFRSMVSGAGHDAMNVADIAPTGMLFVPSVDGISHAPEEYTRPADLTTGADVLAKALQRLAGTP